MPIIDKTFWLIAIAVTCMNAYFLRSRAAMEIARDPELKKGYDQLLKGYLVCLNLPWLMMGIGILGGGVHSVFDYFYPRSGNPYVLAFHVTVFVLWALMIYWIYFGGGAEFLVRHPGGMKADITSPLIMKFLFALMLLGGIAGEIAMWTQALPVLKSPQ